MNVQKNKRIIPTTNEFMKDKRINYQVYLKIQVESNWTDIDVHRYIRKTTINYSVWSKELNISKNTLRKNVRDLINIGILREYKDREGIIYYKICGRYERYILLNIEDSLSLINISKEYKYVIKIYILYYKYSMAYKECKLEQNEILMQIGLSPNGNNRLMLTNVNLILEEKGFIEIKKSSKYKDGITKTMLAISAKAA